MEQPRVSGGQPPSNPEHCRLQAATQPCRKKTDLGEVNKKGIAGDQINKPPSQEQKAPEAGLLTVLKADREVSKPISRQSPHRRSLTPVVWACWFCPGLSH